MPLYFVTEHPNLAWLLITILGGACVGFIIYIWNDKRTDDRDKFAQLEKAMIDANQSLANSVEKLSRAVTDLGDKVFAKTDILASKISTLEAELRALCGKCKERGLSCPGRNPDFMRHFSEFMRRRHGNGSDGSE